MAEAAVVLEEVDAVAAMEAVAARIVDDRGGSDGGGYVGSNGDGSWGSNGGGSMTVETAEALRKCRLLMTATAVMAVDTSAAMAMEAGAVMAVEA